MTGDVASQTNYTELAKGERLNIQNNLSSLQQNIHNRYILSNRAQILFSNYMFNRFNDSSVQDQETLRISGVLANNPRWNI